LNDIDPALAEFLASQGYISLRLMPDGHVAGVNPFLWTYGLCTKLDWNGYDDRWCFESPISALIALADWDGKGDPPGPWIKQKGRVERHNPELYNIIAINHDGSEYAVRKP
jgi:hypothetical protein